MKSWNKTYRKTVDYCQYSSPGDVYRYPKPTDIWTNKAFEPHVCRAGSRCRFFVDNRHVETAQKGLSMSALPATGSVKSEAVYRVPKMLIAELFSDYAGR